MQVISEILSQTPRSLARALDFGVIHAVNPRNLAVVAAMQEVGYLAETTATRGITDDLIADLDWAYAEVLTNGYVPNGVALAPALAVKAVTARNDAQVKLFPEFRPTTEASTLDAFRASTSDTVGVANDLLAIAGDFDAVRWGIQKQIGLEKIEYGDPDGLGDLKRTNEVAFRAEIVYGWGIADIDAFAALTAGDSAGE